MAAGSQSQVSGGISVTGLLGVVFITLKLVGVIDWSWAWVLAPFWLPLAVVLALFFSVLVVQSVAVFLQRRRLHRR